MPATASNINQNTSTKLRFGILCNSYSLKKWQIKVIDNLLEANIAELSLLVINAAPPDNKGFSNKIKSWFSKHFFFRLYNKFFYKPDAIREIDMSERFINIPFIECNTNIKGKYSEYFSDEDINVINGYKLDFILRFGFNIIRGKILDAAKYGVWSYHHDDEETYRGGPAGLWEIYFNDNVNGAILQRLTERLDTGIVLKKGYFKTISHSYSANIDMLYYGCAAWVKQVCTDINNGVADYFLKPPSSSKAVVFRNPTNLKMLKFLAKLLINKIKFHYSELFRTELWNIGIAKLPSASLVDNGIPESEIKWMPVKNNTTYKADCFAFAEGNKLNILYESYDYAKKKGTINKTVFTESDGFTDETIVIDKPYHLSYPYVFRHNNEWYCIPETFNNNKVDLYWIGKGGLMFIKTILEITDAVDSSLYYYNNKWWLFCTKNSDNSNVNLYLYYSDKFDGDYVEHPANPVKTDIRSARPAGNLFVYNNNLYRPAQDSSVSYGNRIVLNKIIKLNTLEFVEEPCGFIMPFKNIPYNKGIHTISIAGDNIIFDVKRYTFVASAFKHNFIKKLKRIKA